ncbi:MAG: DUF6036 family nucleotidyltransferase [bacterium]
MKRHELEHIIRASSGVSGIGDIVVVGSQAILGQYPDAPRDLIVSIEADVFPKGRSDLSVQIDGAIGERSIFHETFGYYAHGVDETTATLPVGWEDRLLPIRNENTGGATGWCLEVHDLAAAKLAAGREKDTAFVAALLRHRMADRNELIRRVDTLPLPQDCLDLIRARLGRMA